MDSAAVPIFSSVNVTECSSLEVSSVGELVELMEPLPIIGDFHGPTSACSILGPAFLAT